MGWRAAKLNNGETKGVFGVFIKQGIITLLNEEIVICREVFQNGVVKPEIHKGVLQEDGGKYFVENGNGRIFLQDGDKIIFSGWERIFRESQ